jgi:hypothetical protein
VDALINLLIATPVHGDVVTTHYMDSLISLLSALRQRGDMAGGRRFFISSSLISRARNAYVSTALADPAVTHLLFIDSDMGFQPSAVLRLLDFDKPYSGCICPYRKMDHDRFHAVSRQIDDPRQARAVAQDYVTADRVLRTAEGKIPVVNGFARTERLGMALTLLKREVLETMSEAYPDLWAPVDAGYKGMGLRERVFQPFENYRLENGLHLSEDMSFSRRWVETGGEIWACLDEDITHVGQALFTGTAAKRLEWEGLL